MILPNSFYLALTKKECTVYLIYYVQMMIRILVINLSSPIIAMGDNLNNKLFINHKITHVLYTVCLNGILLICLVCSSIFECRTCCIISIVLKTNHMLTHVLIIVKVWLNIHVSLLYTLRPT